MVHRDQDAGAVAHAIRLALAALRFEPVVEVERWVVGGGVGGQTERVGDQASVGAAGKVVVVKDRGIRRQIFLPGWIGTVLPLTGASQQIGGRSVSLVLLQAEVHRDAAQVFGVGAAIRRRARVVDEVTRAVGIAGNPRLIRGGVDAVAGVGRCDGVASRITSPFGRMPEVDIERGKRQAGDPGHAADRRREEIAHSAQAGPPFQAWDEHSVHWIDHA